MKISEKSSLGILLLDGQRLVGEIKTRERGLAFYKAHVEELKNQFPMGGERIEVGQTLVATIGAPKTLSKLDKGGLEKFLQSHDKSLADFTTLEKSAPSWAWVED